MMNIFLRNNTPRWIILLIDIFICVFSVIIAYLVRFNFKMLAQESAEIPKVLLIMV